MSAQFISPPPDCPNAGLWRRLAALVYDSFLLFGLLVVPLFVLQAVLHVSDSGYGTEGVAHELPALAPKWMLQLYWVAVIAAFYTYFWRSKGQTLGMQAWRLQLCNRDNEPASLKQCAIRLLVGAPALLLGAAGYWWLWFDREHRTWHDRASKTRVVVLPKRPQ